MPQLFTEPGPAAVKGFKAVLINPYELGRQSFNLAQPTAWLRREGIEVACLDLSLQKLEPEVLKGAGLVAIHLGMHTATRIAVEALPRIRELAPHAELCAFGLYAPLNEERLAGLGVRYLFGGECEPRLTELALTLRDGHPPPPPANEVHLEKMEYLVPERDALPKLERYAHITLADGAKQTVGFAEASRGCKHLCRHCPVVPVYQGKFRVVPVPILMHDIRQQVQAGAGHISFGDPDFVNGPTHALRVMNALHEEFPALTYDATIKVQHLLEHAELLPELKRTGCILITTAVESVDDQVLQHLDKNHTRKDFRAAMGQLRATGIAVAPTFVPFSPWTSLEAYLDLLRELVDLQLVGSVAPVQLTIRLLVPEGSWLLKLPDFGALIGPFDAKLLGYVWQHRDPAIDQLQQELHQWVAASEAEKLPRTEIFRGIWARAHRAAGLAAPELDMTSPAAPIPQLSEPWYCCAEPTEQQLQSF